MTGSAREAMQFVTPTLALIFGLCLLAFWRYLPGQRHLAYFGSAFLLCAGAVLVLLSDRAQALGLTLALSALLYIGGALLLSEGIMKRSGARPPRAFQVAVCTGVVVAVGVFHYAQPSLSARFYLLNLAFALILLGAIWRARGLRKGRIGDRLLFWAPILFVLQLVSRIWLTGDFLQDASFEEFRNSPFWLWLQASTAVLATLFGLALLGVAVADVIEALRLERDSDVLTGLLNRRGFEARAGRLFAEAPDAGFCVVMCDIDHFKRINDSYGHAAGDQVLRQFAAEVRAMLHPGEPAGRIGGEEFAIVMPGISRQEAFRRCEEMRAAVESRAFEGLPASTRVTTSLGIAARRPAEALQATLERADAALYDAKRTGRNRTRTESVAFLSVA